MLYYKVALGESNSNRSKSSFGLRFDNVTYTPDHTIDYKHLAARLAVFDLRMDKHGVEGIYISGTDYLKKYKVNRQNDEQIGDEQIGDEQIQDEQIDEGTDVVAEEEYEEEYEDYDDGLTIKEHISGVLADLRSVAPLGVYIGVGLGVALLLCTAD